MAIFKVLCEGGVGNRLICLANGIWLSRYFGLTFEVLWPVNRYCGAVLADVLVDDYGAANIGKLQLGKQRIDFLITNCENFLGLENIYTFNPCRLKGYEALCRFSSLLRNDSKVVIFLNRILPFAYDDVSSIIQGFRFNRLAIDVCNDFMRTNGLSDKTIAFHLRGTDGFNPLRVGVAVWRIRMRSFFRRQAVLVTDDVRLSDIADRFPFIVRRKNICLPSRSDESQSWGALCIDENHQLLPYNVRRDECVVFDAIVDLILLSRCRPALTSFSTFLEVAVIKSEQRFSVCRIAFKFSSYIRPLLGRR